ncbi:hypothetical protein SDC9_189253 [bioreactor metagenome]|uniref:Glycosyl transferase family 1 domain-containing protein n=1 Tax=bioreactor metagenome TaxID=1076179 RepID=A0A645HRM2_9ZZZZ
MARYIEILMEDKEKYEYMKKRSVEIFEEKFTAEIYARNIEKIYAGVLGKC